MAESNKIRFLLFVALMIFPACALDVILSGAHQDFKQKSEIHIDIMDGEKIYRGTSNRLTYEAELGISKVIVYIISRSRCIEILRPAVSETRSQIARELREMHYELVILGIEHFDDDEYHLIGAFILEKIQPHPDQPDQPVFTIETIGENCFDQFYRCHVLNFKKYQENAQISGGNLLARLRSIPRGALRPVGSNGKEIKSWGYQPSGKEVRWSVSVENDTYVPNVNLSDPTYNFVARYPKKRICLFILNGKEYSEVTSYGNRCMKRAAMKKFLGGMKMKKEVLLILGVFNFDWTEIDIVTQIILKHSKGSQNLDYNVFTCGYGMFNTHYQNVYEGDGRDIRQQPYSHVSEVVEILMGEEMKKRAIIVYYYFDGDLKVSNIPINLINGRYFAEEEFENFTLSSKLLNQKIAFIVYDQNEMNVPVDYSVAGQSVEELERSGISVVLIRAINFRLDDMHTIAEWIDHHSGVNDSEQIAVLGGGIFNTIFQSESTTYNKFLNTKKNELETIRNAYAKSGNGKSISTVQLDQHSTYEVRSYPMNTVVNGFYEPDLIPDKNMFNTTGGRKIYFIVTSGYNFQRISTMGNFRSVAASFRQNIKQHFPGSKWSVFLVGLDNFDERDSHLFAELVNRQTNDERSLGEFIRETNCGISDVTYQYKDSAPFDFDGPYSFLHMRFISFFLMDMPTSI